MSFENVADFVDDFVGDQSHAGKLDLFDVAATRRTIANPDRYMIEIYMNRNMNRNRHG